jgi:hypothetical protein
MKKITVVGAMMCIVAAMAMSAMGQGALDGKSYKGTLTAAKDGKSYDETVIFKNGTMRSTACESQGFKAGKYTAIDQNGTTVVKGSVSNEKGDVNEFELTVKGDAMTGTLTGKTADGAKGDTMTLTAKVEKPVKKEHPTKREHPSHEHPR